jgi:hypothetical protein
MLKQQRNYEWMEEIIYSIRDNEAGIIVIRYPHIDVYAD